MSIIKKFDKSNLLEVLSYFGFNQINSPSQQFNDDAPQWFLAYVAYYDQKEDLIELFGELGIKYPSWIRSIKMPYEYNEEELQLVFNTLHKMYVCNGQIFGTNLGFWYRDWFRYKFNVKDSLNNVTYAELPWQLLLKNPLLKEDKWFNQILEVLEKGKSHSEYFLRLYKYQKLTKEHIESLIKAYSLSNPKYKNSDHDELLKCALSTFKSYNAAKVTQDKMSERSHSSYYFTNYPEEYQVLFILQQDKVGKQVELISRSTLKEEKKKEMLRKVLL
jgi:hypothetical protein